MPRTTFVGRHEELREVRRLLATTRLVTLTGPGGCGKTRLAQHVAAKSEAAEPQTVWFVELGHIDQPDDVPRTIASALGVPDDEDRATLDAVSASIGGQDVLLVLDGCEHVADASAQSVDELLRTCPRLRVLATSREVLRVQGEGLLPLNPLPVPPPDCRETPEVLSGYDSVQLFCDRVMLNQPDFSLTAENSAPIAAICRRLDGLPLAIELAAARVPVLSPNELAARIEERFEVLISPLRGLPERQRTLRGTIDWSYDLLSEAERSLLARLAVFSGTFSLDAVEAVCVGDEITSTNVLDLVGALAARSLVQIETVRSHTRYRLLESIREYAAEKLEASDGETTVRTLHLDWYTELAERAERELRGPEQARWLDVLESEHENMTAAMRWALAQDRTDEALRVAIALSAFWEVRGYLGEGRFWLDAAAHGSPMSVLRARALVRAATLARLQGDFTATRALSEEALSLLEGSGDDREIASSLALLGSVSEGPSAGSFSGDSLAMARQLREVDQLSSSIRELGSLAWEEGDVRSARALHEESLAISRRIGDTTGEADSLTWLGNIGSATAQWTVATSNYEAALDLYRELGDDRREADVLSNLGLVAHVLQESERAAELHRASLAIRREVGHRRGIAVSCLNLAELLMASGDQDEARSLLHEALAVAEALGDERIEAAARRIAQHDRGAVVAQPDQGRRPEPDQSTGVFRREGEFWTIEFEGRMARLKDSKGLRHLGALLDAPRRELHVLHLVRALEGGGGPGRRRQPLTDDHLDRLVVESDPFGETGRVLDDEAKAAFRSRLDELREELGEAESWGDPERASRARDEIEKLTEQFAGALGIGSGDPKSSSASERARWSVSRAIRNAIRRINEALPALGEHLEATIRTGTYCSYWPDPRAALSWHT